MALQSIWVASTAPPLVVSAFPSSRTVGGRRRKCRPRAAVVEAKPQPAPDGAGGGERGRYAVQAYRGSSSAAARAGEMQAESRAMSRAANAPVYNPDLLALRYGSRPVKVPSFSDLGWQVLLPTTCLLISVFGVAGKF